MNPKIRRQLRRCKRRIQRRLDKSRLGDCLRPMFRASNIQYEMGEKTQAIDCGGIGLIHLLSQRLGLVSALDEKLHVLKMRLPYHESDHVLNIAYNVLCGGTCLQDLELRRNDEVYLNALGAQRIPDPTTAGDFCRRFSITHIRALLEVYHLIRKTVWAQQPAEFFQQPAIVDVDGAFVETSGECKEGIGYSYKGQWGYHPLVVSLANTQEVLSLVNRSGNRPSHEGAAEELDRAAQVCLEGGFQEVLLRGDTDFSQTTHLDRWDALGNVKFIFGLDAMPNLKKLADELPAEQWKRLKRPPPYKVKTEPRARPTNVKQQIVVENEYKDLRRESEDVTEFEYRPTACKTTYRLVAKRNNIGVHQGQQRLFDDCRYFFYITNDREKTAEEVVLSANDRCDQENLNAHLKGGVRALRAPLDTLLANWAYMVIVMLAWNLKAWWALLLPERPGRWAEPHRQEKRQVLRMEFKTFVNALVRAPCQVVRSGRKLIFRFLSWNPWRHVFFRLFAVLRC